MEVIGDVYLEIRVSLSALMGLTHLDHQITSGGVSSSEDSEKTDLLAALQAAAMQPAIKPSPMQISTASSVCWLVCRCSGSDTEDDVELADVVLTKIKPLGALTDLHMTRLTGNDKNLKAKDTHEFLMVCLAHLKEEGELLQSYWPKYTCPVANRRRTCNSCGFQRSFRETSRWSSVLKDASLTFCRSTSKCSFKFQQIEALDGSCRTQYGLAGVVSLLGSSLYCGHYISHIRDFTGHQRHQHQNIQPVEGIE